MKRVVSRQIDATKSFNEAVLADAIETSPSLLAQSATRRRPMSDTPRVRSVARYGHAAVIVALLVVPPWTAGVPGAETPATPGGDADVRRS